MESLARYLSTGRTLPEDLRFDIENFKETVASDKNSPPSMKRLDARVTRSPSPIAKKSDFNIRERCNCEIDAAELAMDIDDSGPNSIITLDMPQKSVSNTSKPNGISFANTSTNSFSHRNNDLCTALDSSVSHANSNGSRSSKFVDNVPLSIINQHSVESNDEKSLGSCNGDNKAIGCSPTVREIPTSPHLSKDFSANGERLRSSIRARRQERIQKQRSLRTLVNLMTQQSTCSSDSGNENSISFITADDIDISDHELPTNYFSNSRSPFARINDIKPTAPTKKSKPYGDKGFIINVNDGSLTINDVKDLNNCYSDDFDSSCDTSLNYIDNDTLNVTPIDGSHKNDVRSPKFIKNATFEVALPEPDESIEAIAKYTLDEVRENLNKCKTKLNALEIGDSKHAKHTQIIKTHTTPPKVSLNDISSPKKTNIEQSTNDTSRLNPSSSPILNSRSANLKNNKVNDQPVKKVNTKRNDVHQTKQPLPPKSSNSKNYCKSTLAYIERISDVDRHTKSASNYKKTNNKMLHSNFADGPSTNEALVVRKPPTPNPPKKRAEGAKMTSTKNADKQKKMNGRVSPSRKIL